MRWVLPMVLVLSVALVGCGPRLRQIIPADIPEGTVFEPLENVHDFAVTAKLRIVRDPDSPTDGVAAVIIYVISKSTDMLSNLHAAIWLPEGVLFYTPVALIGSNLDAPFRVDLSPDQPKSGYLTDFRFKDFSRRDEIIAAFDGPTRVKILWEGGVRFLQFPGSLWEVEIVEEMPPRL